MKSLPFTLFKSDLQFVPDTKEHRVTLKEAGIAYCKVSDVLVTKCPPELGEGGFGYADKLGIDKYELKRFLTARYLDAQEEEVEHEARQVAMKSLQQNTKIDQSASTEWIAFVDVWKKHIKDEKFSLVIGTRRVSGPFDPEMFVRGVQYGFCWTIDKRYSPTWTLEFREIKMRTEEANGISWNMQDGVPGKMCVSTPAVRELLTTISSSGMLWDEVAGVILATKCGDVTLMRNHTALMKNVKEAVKAFEKDKRAKEVAKRHPPHTLLEKSNFYELVTEQMGSNAEETSFCFEPLADTAEDAAFREALRISTSFKRCDVLFSSLHVVSTREKNFEGKESTTFASFMGDASYLLLLFFSLCMVASVMGGIGWLFNSSAENVREAVQILTCGCAGLVVCLVLGLVHATVFYFGFVRHKKTLVLKE